jgi:capsular polysaccharide biosynthesis protein
MLGFFQASKTGQLFQSSGTLSASTNPLVPDPSIDGINSQFWESPAQATSRSLNERLGTENFMQAIVDEAGLSESVDAGLLDIAYVRQHIWATANGDSILAVHAQWDDPQTSYDLANATIAQFQDFLEATASSKASAAEEYWTARLARLEEQRAGAEQALTTYVESLPELDADQDYPVPVQVQLEALRDSVSSLQEKISGAEEKIDEAVLLRTQESSEASESITIIDAPQVPGAPVSTVMKRIMLVMSFMMLGFVIAFAALLVTTVLDHSVSSPADLLAIAEIPLVATIPPVKFGQFGNGKHRRSRGRKQGDAHQAGVV